MRSVVVSLLLTLRDSLRTRTALQLEIRARRHQRYVVNRSRPQRRRLTNDVVMESTAQYCRPVSEALEQYWRPVRRTRAGASPVSGPFTLRKRNPIVDPADARGTSPMRSGW
jgi:hypothetical protein